MKAVILKKILEPAHDAKKNTLCKKKPLPGLFEIHSCQHQRQSPSLRLPTHAQVIHWEMKCVRLPLALLFTAHWLLFWSYKKSRLMEIGPFPTAVHSTS